MTQNRLPIPIEGPVGSPVPVPAEDWRLATGAFVLSGLTDLAHRRGGVLPGVSMGRATVNGPNSITLDPFQAWVPGTSTAQQGGYLVASLAPVTFTPASPASGKFRRDLIVAVVRDRLYDQGTQTNWDTVPVTGAEAATAAGAVAPAVPPNALLLADYTITSGGVITVNAGPQVTVATGGVLPTGTGAAPTDPGVFAGQPAVDTTGAIWVWVAGSWKNVTGGSYIPLAQRGVASGVATLDTGAKVPVAQLPAGQPSGVASLDGAGQVPLGQLGNVPQPLRAILTAPVGVAASASVNPAGLIVAAVPVGTYKIRALVDARNTATASSFGGYRLAVTPGSGLTGTTFGLVLVTGSYPAGMPALGTPTSQTVQATVGTGQSTGGMTLDGILVVTAAGSLGVTVQETGGYAITLAQGSHLELTKIA